MILFLVFGPVGVPVWARSAIGRALRGSWEVTFRAEGMSMITWGSSMLHEVQRTSGLDAIRLAGS